MNKEEYKKIKKIYKEKIREQIKSLNGLHATSATQETAKLLSEMRKTDL